MIKERPYIHLIGDDRDQVKNTLEWMVAQQNYPDYEIPKRRAIKKSRKLSYGVSAPMSLPKDNIHAIPLNGFELFVNARAYYDFIENLGNNPQKGELYFLPLDSIIKLLVPKRVIEAVNDYHWIQHREEVDTLLEKWKRSFGELLAERDDPRPRIAPPPFTQN